MGYSAMTLSKVASELLARDLVAVPRMGKTRHLDFRLPRRALWEKALPVLSSPVHRRLFYQGHMPATKAGVLAGLTALERHTAIADARLPTIAVWRNRLRPAIRSGSITVCQLPEEAEAMLEEWTYDPTRLVDGECVDHLSLYLSLRTSHDERVQKELSTLLEDMPW